MKCNTYLEIYQLIADDINYNKIQNLHILKTYVNFTDAINIIDNFYNISRARKNPSITYLYN